MGVRHLKFLVEEPSMEAFLRALLPRLWPPPDRTFEIHLFQGKLDLLAKLEDRLKAYATWYGYFPGGLGKIEAARAIGAHIDPGRSVSPSFRTFYQAIAEARGEFGF